jgi:hypothetical protein
MSERPKPKKPKKSKLNCLSCRFCDYDEDDKITFCWLILKIVKKGRTNVNLIPCKKYQKKEPEISFDDLLKELPPNIRGV